MMLFETLDTEEKAQEFRKDRLGKIDNGEIWSPMSEGPYCVVHWLPVSGRALFDVDDLNSLEFSDFIQMERGGCEKEPNANGVRFYSTEKDEIKENNILMDEGLKPRHFWNAQIFHSGTVEMVFALSFWDRSDEIKQIPQKLLIKNLWKVMDGFKACMSSFNITAPIIVGVSLLRAMDYRLFVDGKEGYTGPSDPRSDTEQIILPEALMENLDNMEKEERQIFDMLWRHFNFRKCEYYDDEGRRKDIK